MKKFLAMSVLLFGLVTNPLSAQPENSSLSEQLNTENEIRAANNQFYVALNAMFAGHFAPMSAVWSHGDDVTYMGPFGGRLVGWEAVGAAFQKNADLKLGGRIVCKDLIVHAGGDLGYTVCVEQGENTGADGKPVLVSHRATNIFRREDGQWKLVHHHTDISPQLEKAFESGK